MSASTHRVHGLAADEVAPDWPTVTDAELRELLTRYPQLGELQHIAWHSPRPLSAAALVETTSGRVFVKRHHQRVRTPHTLSQEHHFAGHLRKRGVPTPRIIPSATGQTAIGIGEWTWEIQACAEGIDLYRDALSWTPPSAPAHARNASAALASLHRAAADYLAPQRDTHILVARDDLLRAPNLIDALLAQLPERPALAAYLSGRDWQADFARVLRPRHRTLQPRLAQLPRHWAHNDWHVSNLCWTGTGPQAHVASVLDFGLASPTSTLFDLATAIERNAIAWLELDIGNAAVHDDIADALIEGYRQHAELSAVDLRLLADLLPLVHVDFALSEVEYFFGVTGSTADADVAYDTFLLGHAEWFEHGPAQRLLASISKGA